MPLIRETPDSEIDRTIEEGKRFIIESIIRSLQYCGEMCVNQCRNSSAPHTYTDRTGNLRSSTGYIIVNDGKIVSKSGFQQISGTATDGTNKGLSYALSLVSKYPKGLVLIVVAGMSYAGYVANLGYDVLDSSKLLAKRICPLILKDLGFKKIS